MKSVATKRSPVKNSDRSTYSLPDKIPIIVTNGEIPIYTNFSRRPELYNKEEVHKWLTVTSDECNNRLEKKSSSIEIGKCNASEQLKKRINKYSIPEIEKENEIVHE